MVVSSEWKGNLIEISKMKSGREGSSRRSPSFIFCFGCFFCLSFFISVCRQFFCGAILDSWSLLESLHIQHWVSYVRLFVTLRTIAHQVPLSMGFSRQAYWSRLPWPPPGDLPGLRIKPVSPKSTWIGRWVLYTRATWEAPLESTVWQLKLISQSVWLIREPSFLYIFLKWPYLIGILLIMVIIISQRISSSLVGPLVPNRVDSLLSGHILRPPTWWFWKAQWLRDKESACSAGDTGDLDWIPGLGRSPGGGNGNPVQYSCLENIPCTEGFFLQPHGVRHNWATKDACILMVTKWSS